VKGRTLKFIDISGFGHSGKTIVSDYLKENNRIFSFDNNVEFELIRVPGGLLDLYYSIFENWSLIRSSKRIKDFKKLIFRIGITPSISNPITYFNSSGHSYEQLFKNNFISESLDFIDKIVISTDRTFWPYENLTSNTLNLVLSKFKLKFFNKLIESEILYTKRENFLFLVNEYLNNLFLHIANNSESHVLLNNSCEPFSPECSLKILGDSYSIIVDRDPRDIYASQINQEDVFIPNFELKSGIYKMKKKMTNFENLQGFIERYKILHENISDINHTRVLRIKFEDFILDHKKSISNINNFLNLETNYEAKFNVSDSIKNVGIWRKYKDLNEIKIIERELKKYCY